MTDTGTMNVELAQQARASLQFLGSVQEFAGATLQKRAAQEYERAVPNPPSDLDGRRESVYAALENSAAWAFDRLLTRWVAEEIYVRALPAIETIRPHAEEWLDVKAPSGSLRLDADLVPPAYWAHGFHLTPGGWDGHELMGPAISELAFAYVLTPGGVGAVRTGENLNDQRTMVAAEAPRENYRHIVEFGAGTGRFTFKLRNTYPSAAITAVDLSQTALRFAYAQASAVDARIDWIQAAAENSGMPDGCADLVTSYTLMHEVPESVNRRILAEALRILEPGGDLVISEIAPYEYHSAFRAVVLDWETENRGEPYWREVMAMDLPAALADIGFVDIEAYGVGGGIYPWVTRARKPLRTDGVAQ
jgi:SAM-dependent methyltransferase